MMEVGFGWSRVKNPRRSRYRDRNDGFIVGVVVKINSGEPMQGKHKVSQTTLPIPSRVKMVNIRPPYHVISKAEKYFHLFLFPQ